jgi:hypothetical protein
MNREAVLPFQLRLDDFALAMQDIYDFFYDVNVRLVERGLERLDDMLRPAIMSGLLSDMLRIQIERIVFAVLELDEFGNCFFGEFEVLRVLLDPHALISDRLGGSQCRS